MQLRDTLAPDRVLVDLVSDGFVAHLIMAIWPGVLTVCFLVAFCHPACMLFFF
jgi:hypothetical protein